MHWTERIVRLPRWKHTYACTAPVDMDRQAALVRSLETAWASTPARASSPPPATTHFPPPLRRTVLAYAFTSLSLTSALSTPASRYPAVRDTVSHFASKPSSLRLSLTTCNPITALRRLPLSTPRGVSLLVDNPPAHSDRGIAFLHLASRYPDRFPLRNKYSVCSQHRQPHNQDVGQPQL